MRHSTSPLCVDLASKRVSIRRSGSESSVDIASKRAPVRTSSSLTSAFPASESVTAASSSVSPAPRRRGTYFKRVESDRHQPKHGTSKRRRRWSTIHESNERRPLPAGWNVPGPRPGHPGRRRRCGRPRPGKFLVVIWTPGILESSWSSSRPRFVLRFARGGFSLALGSAFPGRACPHAGISRPRDHRLVPSSDAGPRRRSR